MTKRNVLLYVFERSLREHFSFEFWDHVKDELVPNDHRFLPGLDGEAVAVQLGHSKQAWIRRHLGLESLLWILAYFRREVKDVTCGLPWYERLQFAWEATMRWTKRLIDNDIAPDSPSERELFTTESKKRPTVTSSAEEEMDCQSFFWLWAFTSDKSSKACEMLSGRLGMPNQTEWGLACDIIRPRVASYLPTLWKIVIPPFEPMRSIYATWGPLLTIARGRIQQRESAIGDTV